MPCHSLRISAVSKKEPNDLNYQIGFRRVPTFHIIHIHVLRSSAATTMSESGISERNIMEAGHWKDQKAFSTYVVKKRDLSAVEIWNEIDPLYAGKDEWTEDPGLGFVKILEFFTDGNSLIL